jgi:hypothetical protein
MRDNAGLAGIILALLPWPRFHNPHQPVACSTVVKRRRNLEILCRRSVGSTGTFRAGVPRDPCCSFVDVTINSQTKGCSKMPRNQAQSERLFDSYAPIMPKLNADPYRLECLGEQPRSEALPLQAGLLVMVNKAIDVTRLLPKCMISGEQDYINISESATLEIHCQEHALTAGLLSATINRQLVKGVIELPGDLERIGQMLRSILSCFQIKAQNSIPFSDRAYAELDQLFAFLLNMMANLKDELATPNEVLLEHIISCGKKVSQALIEFRFAHWVRLKTGFCALHASSIYLDLLDSMKTINEYLVRICVALLELGTACSVLFGSSFEKLSAQLPHSVANLD